MLSLVRTVPCDRFRLPGLLRTSLRIPAVSMTLLWPVKLCRVPLRTLLSWFSEHMPVALKKPTLALRVRRTMGWVVLLLSIYART